MVMEDTPQFTPEQEAAIEKRFATRQAAAVDPAPGPLLDAFLPEPALAAGMELQPIVASHLLILKRLGLEIFQAGATHEDEEVFELLYVFTRPIAEVRAALAAGRPEFREKAMLATADKLTIDSIPSVEAAITSHFLKATGTALSYKPPASTDGSFQTPPRSPATGSVGG